MTTLKIYGYSTSEVTFRKPESSSLHREVMYYISKKKDDDKGLSRILKGDKCEIAQRESFRVGSSLGKNDFRQQRLFTIHSLYTSL